MCWSVGRSYHFWIYWINTTRYPCTETLRGPSRIYAGERILNRNGKRLDSLLKARRRQLLTRVLGSSSASSTCKANLFFGRRSFGGCLLGYFLSIWRIERPNSGCDWIWSMSSTCRVAYASVCLGADASPAFNWQHCDGRRYADASGDKLRSSSRATGASIQSQRRYTERGMLDDLQYHRRQRCANPSSHRCQHYTRFGAPLGNCWL